MIRTIKNVGLLCLASLTVACNNGASSTPNVTMTMPEVISDVREVNKDNVSPQVLLNGNTEIPMRPAEGRDGYTGTINVSPSTTYLLSVIWREYFPTRDEYLELARVDKEITTNAEGTTVENIGNNEYRTDMDLDGDGVSNLQERINGTDPFPDNNDADGTSDGEIPNDPGTTGVGDAGSSDGSDSSAGDTGSSDAGNSDGSSTAGSSTGADGSTDGTTNNTDGGATTSGTDGTTQGGDDGSDASDGSTTNGSDSGSDGSNTDGSDDGSDGSTTDGTDGNTDGGSTAGNASDATVVIPRISSSEAPSIDGAGLEFLGDNGELIGEWANAVQFDINGAPLHVNNLMIDNNAEAGDGTPYRRWAAMHDGDRLYVLVLVDDDGNRHSDSNLAYQDDSLELFIDGDNSKLSDYDGVDDFQFIMPMLQFGTSDSNNQQDGRLQVGQFSSTESIDLVFTTGPGIGPDGIRRPRYEQDVYELSIDLSAAGIVPGLSFGFDVHVNDDDDGDNRDSKWGWAHPSRGTQDVDNTWMNPSFMGTVVLEE